jgi:hypothetical protein
MITATAAPVAEAIGAITLMRPSVSALKKRASAAAPARPAAAPHARSAVLGVLGPATSSAIARGTRPTNWETAATASAELLRLASPPRKSALP